MRLGPDHAFWTAGLLTWLINFWWFSFSLTQVETWTVGHLLFVLLYPSLIYFLLALLHPGELKTDFDTSAHLESNRPWFFGGLFLLGSVEMLDAWTKESAELLQPENALGPTAWYPVFMLAWLIASLVAIRVRNRRFNTLFAAVFLIGAVALLFSNGSLGSFGVSGDP